MSGLGWNRWRSFSGPGAEVPGAPTGGSWARVLARHFHWCDGLRGARSMDGRTTYPGTWGYVPPDVRKESRVAAAKVAYPGAGRAAPDHRCRALAIRAGGF